MLFAAFLLCEVTLVGRGATPLDRLFYPAWTDAGVNAENYIHQLYLRFVLRAVVGMAPMIAISLIPIALAFGGDRRSALMQLALGPIMGTTAKRKNLLIHGEVLGGVAVAIYICGLLSMYALRLGVTVRAIPDAYAVAAVAFWGSLAQIAWFGKWHGFWRYALTASFVVLVPFVAYALIACNEYVTTVGMSFLLGAAMLCVTRWCIYRYA